MADFINATIDRHEFDTLLEIMKDRAVHLKPIMAVTGNMVVKSVRRNFREGGRPEKWEKSKFSPGSKRARIRSPMLRRLVLCGFASDWALKKSKKFDEIFTFWPNFERLGKAML